MRTYVRMHTHTHTKVYLDCYIIPFYFYLSDITYFSANVILKMTMDGLEMFFFYFYFQYRMQHYNFDCTI